MMRIIEMSVVAGALSFGGLAGCGQKGPLVPVPAPAAAAATSAPAR